MMDAWSCYRYFEVQKSLILLSGFRERSCIPFVSSKIETCIPNHIHQGQHQQRFVREQFSDFLPYPASRPGYRIIRLIASGTELVTNQRPEGLFIQRVADHEPIGAADLVRTPANRWIASGSLLFRFLDREQPCPLPHALYKDVALSYIVGRNTITREMLSC